MMDYNEVKGAVRIKRRQTNLDRGD